MKKSSKFLKMACFAFLLCIITIAVRKRIEFNSDKNGAASIVIIGGADGPTAIFTTSKQAE